MTVTDPFTFHGMEIEEKNDQLVGECPFCGKPDKFYADPTTFQFDCKVCGENGNLYGFLSKLHEMSLKITTKQQYEKLSKFRKGIPWEKYREHKFALNPLNGSWIVPSTNGDGKLSNMLALLSGRLMSTPTCKLHCYYPNKGRSNTTLYICESRWDFISLEWLLERVNKKGSIMLLPSATVFKPEWAKYLRDMNVVWCEQNDPPTKTGKAGAAEQGRHKILATCQKEKVQMASFQHIKWPGSVPPKYDIDNLITENLKTPNKAYTILGDMLETIDLSPIPPREDGGGVIKAPCETFNDLLEQFRGKLHMDKELEECLAICCAAVVSVKLPLDPLWIFLVGPPSSGKTTLIETFGGSPDYCELVSKMTSTALVSGWKGPEGEDCSLLPTLNGRCLFVKDFTTVLSMPATVKIELFGLLRDASDGSVHIPKGNNEYRKYDDLTFSNVSGVTDVIRKEDLALEGDRFLMVEILSEIDTQEDDKIRSGILSVDPNTNGTKWEKIKYLQSYVLGFLDRPFDIKQIPSMPAWYVDRVINLAKLVAKARASVDRDSKGHLMYRPRAEMGTRLGKQLAKLGMCLAYVYGEDEISQSTYALVRKVAFDTIKGFNVDIIKLLAAKGSGGMTLHELSNTLPLNPHTVKRIMEDLFELRQVVRTKAPNNSGRGGRDISSWILSPEMREIWQNTIPKVIKRKKVNR